MITNNNDEWRVAATKLKEQGYTLEWQQDNETIPAIFTKPGSESLYLFRPVMDKHYLYAVGPWVFRWAAKGKSTIVAPSLPVDRLSTLWLPRPLRARQAWYGVRMIAEHTGVKIETVQNALTKGKLKPDATVERVRLFGEQTVTAWVRARRGTPSTLSKNELHLRNFTKLVSMVGNGIVVDEAGARQVAEMIGRVSGFGVDMLMELLRWDSDNALELLETHYAMMDARGKKAMRAELVGMLLGQ